MSSEKLLERISINPDICFGKPCIRGHRIWVSLILDFLANGASVEAILQDYPQLEEPDIMACIAYGAEMSRERGYVFYFGSARRDEVIIDETLRGRTLALLAEAHHIATLNHPPAPITNWRKCRDCSLEPICLPREVLAMFSRKVNVEDGNCIPD